MRWLLVVSGLLTTVAARADDGSYEASIDGALEFAECAGLYYASADLGPEFGHSPDDVDLALGLGNGAALAGQYLLAHVRVLSQPLESGAPIPRDVWNKAWQEAGTYIDDQVASNRVHWRSRLRGSGNPQVAKQAQICSRLNPVQTEIIGEMRQNALTAPWPDSGQ
jgi:hypothetical protein